MEDIEVINKTVNECLQSTVDIILFSRGDCSPLFDQSWNKDFKGCISIEIIAQPKADIEDYILIEKWTFDYISKQPFEKQEKVLLSLINRRLVTLQRTLYCYVRLIPGFLLCTREHAPPVKFRVLRQLDINKGFPFCTDTETYRFPIISSAYENVVLSVEYLSLKNIEEIFHDYYTPRQYPDLDPEETQSWRIVLLDSDETTDEVISHNVHCPYAQLQPQRYPATSSSPSSSDIPCTCPSNITYLHPHHTVTPTTVTRVNRTLSLASSSDSESAYLPGPFANANIRRLCKEKKSSSEKAIKSNPSTLRLPLELQAQALTVVAGAGTVTGVAAIAGAASLPDYFSFTTTAQATTSTMATSPMSSSLSRRLAYQQLNQRAVVVYTHHSPPEHTIDPMALLEIAQHQLHQHLTPTSYHTNKSSPKYPTTTPTPPSYDDDKNTNTTNNKNEDLTRPFSPQIITPPFSTCNGCLLSTSPHHNISYPPQTLQAYLPASLSLSPSSSTSFHHSVTSAMTLQKRFENVLLKSPSKELEDMLRNSLSANPLSIQLYLTELPLSPFLVNNNNTIRYQNQNHSLLPTLPTNNATTTNNSNSDEQSLKDNNNITTAITSKSNKISNNNNTNKMTKDYQSGSSSTPPLSSSLPVPSPSEMLLPFRLASQLPYDYDYDSEEDSDGSTDGSYDTSDLSMPFFTPFPPPPHRKESDSDNETSHTFDMNNDFIGSMGGSGGDSDTGWEFSVSPSAFSSFRTTTTTTTPSTTSSGNMKKDKKESGSIFPMTDAFELLRDLQDFKANFSRV